MLFERSRRTITELTACLFRSKTTERKQEDVTMDKEIAVQGSCPCIVHLVRSVVTGLLHRGMVEAIDMAIGKCFCQSAHDAESAV